MNMNMNIFGGARNIKHNHIKHNFKKHQKQSTTENIVTVTGQGILEETVKEEISTNCASSNKKKQRYSSSFFANTTDHVLAVEKEFHDVVGNNSKVKKSGSVHEGEDITLCWIETTTLKEDKTTRPSKRLVIREYTISFENSATIPERYLECKRFEGELTANDPDIGKTALFEIIDEDTMVSRIVNFTSVSHVGDIITWQHKKVKCGVGPVVSKNIIELNDGSKNPKKRVEIKVSPKMHQLTATTTEEECTETSTFTESITEHTTELPCENGDCEATTHTTSPSISSQPDKISTEKIITKLQSESESESEEDLFTATKSLTLPDEVVSRRSTTFPKIPVQEKIDCEENPSDPKCITQEYVTSSSEELFTTTEVAAVVETSSISDRVTLKEEIFRPSVEERPKKTTQSTSKEEEEITDLVTEETTPFATDIFMKSSETYVPQSTDQTSVETRLETNITTNRSVEVLEESLKSEEGSNESYTILTSEELEEIDHVSSSSEDIVTSSEVTTGPDVITISPVEIIEFTKLSKPGRIFDKVTESPISIESVTGAITIESSSMSEEVTSEESKENIRSVIEESTLQSSEEKEFISITTTSPTKTESTTLLPVTSGEVGYTCEDSEDCATSEGCDEFGNCGKTTTRCDSEVCSEEEIIEDQKPQPKFDTTSRLPRLTKVPLSTDLSEESAIIEHTTITNVATIMFTSQESENRSMIGHITMDTRRSTTTSAPQHKLTLKVKVLLEHINENKEKQNLVEVEKQLSLDENLEHHVNPDLLEQLKTLNDSVNMETISALLNCTSLGNLTKDLNFINKKQDDVLDRSDIELEFTNTDLDDSISEQFTSESVEAKTDYSDYQEHEVVISRRRRSLDNEMEALNRFARQSLFDPTDSVVDTFNISQTQRTEVTKDNLQLSTTTNHLVEETTTNNYTESERKVTKERDQGTTPSTIVSLNDDVDLSNTSEFHDANVTKNNIQLITTTYKPKEETSNTVNIENERNITNERNESTVPSIRQNINNGTKIEVMRKTLSGIQNDVVVGLQHMVSQLTQSNLTSVNNVKKAVKTNLLDILADPTDDRIRLRRRRATTEEIGHWSNERIKEAPMGGNLRSFTEFTLYKILS